MLDAQQQNQSGERRKNKIFSCKWERFFAEQENTIVKCFDLLELSAK